MSAPLGADSLIQKAADLYGIAVADMLAGSTRQSHVVRARQAAAWLLREQGLSLPRIGTILGCHHTTVLWSCRRVDADQAVRAMLTRLEVVA